jgi:tripartite-type tricarboxylate transporter receptor subunit TctC
LEACALQLRRSPRKAEQLHTLDSDQLWRKIHVAGRKELNAALHGAIVAASSLLCLTSARAQEAPTFKNKTFVVLSASAPNGGFDAYGRVFARFLGAHLPGNPTVVVQNMPGAGGLLGVNYISNVAPRDGSEIAVVGQIAAMNQALGMSGVHYDVRRLTWVGRLTSNTQVLFTWHTSGIKTIQDAMTHQVVMAGTSAASTSVIVPQMLNDFVGTKFKIVRGYDGSPAAILAVESEEAEAATQPWNAIKATNPGWLRDKKINVIAQLALRRNPELAEVPTVVELVHNQEQRQLLGLFVSGGDVGYSIVAPPQLALPVAATLRKAFNDVMDDPKFIAAAKAERLTLDPLPGDELQKINDEQLDLPEKTVDQAKKYIAGK